MKLLCLSNGHGEDAIALRILMALKSLNHPPDIAALPLVGEGGAYLRVGIPVIGPVKAMPSGGFIYMDGKQLARDVQGGLLQLTLDQLKTVRQWGRSGGRILAVGDIVPLLFAWLSGVDYAFVGTAKSEYYLRDEQGLVPRLSWFDHLENWSGSVYLPWERWLMSRPRCKAVIPRDRLTTETLRRWPIPAYDLGNPMMDGLDPTDRLIMPPFKVSSGAEPLKILLLPGSRAPEVHHNWQLILRAIASVQRTVGDRPLVFLAAIAPSLNLRPFLELLPEKQWQWVKNGGGSIADQISVYGQVCYRGRSERPFLEGTGVQETGNLDTRDLLVLTQSAFGDCLHQAEMAIALAGTATEQLVGLGKPAITIPGSGPQFTPAFAEAQTRLLGPSVVMVPDADAVGEAIAHLLAEPERRHQIYQNGIHRMGRPGAAQRIADCLMQVF
ncbi:MAG: lipid-A-disaccharide synthase-related protein [Leptolyngbyaceae cyanobacterium]